VSADRYIVDVRDAVITQDLGGIEQATRDALAAGIPPVEVITKGLAGGLRIVGEKFERHEYFLSDLVVAGEVAKDGMRVALPHLRGASVATRGRVVLATVRGDHHDIGKSLVATLLEASGFDVVDLGVDVPTAEIVAAVEAQRPQVLGLSALLTVTMPMMAEVIRALEAAGLRDSVKVIVGGSPVTTEFAEAIGADARAASAVDGVRRCRDWVTVQPTR
jgi:5-methyltetrahydrofolate--homocysteine methyltransferase